MKKKFITFMMVAAMVLGSTVSAFAADSPGTNNSPDTNNSSNTGESGPGSGNVDPDDGGDDELGDGGTTTTPGTGTTTPGAGNDKNPSGSTADPDADKDTTDVKDGGVVSKEEAVAIQKVAKVEGSKETLVVAVVAKDSADYKVVAAAKELKDVKYTVIDLSFESKAQPKAGTKITLPVAKLAEIKDAKYVSVYAVKDAKMELVDVVKVDKDGNFSFAPKHFSTYVFAAATEAQFNENAKADGTTGSSVGSAEKTGDTAPVVVMFAVAAAAMGCVVVANKKRKEA